MINNKNGLSGIVTALILIGIGLAAVGVVWYVLNTTIQEQETQVANASSQVYQSCVDAGYHKMNTTLTTCGATLKYVGGEKCCTEAPTA